MDPEERALVAELARRSGLVWVGWGEPRRDRPVWHVWHDEAVCVVANGDEQPLPGVDDVAEVEVSLRSKATRDLLARVTASVEVVRPDDERWPGLTDVLRRERLNLAAGAVERWAGGSTVVRLVPTAVLEAPGRLGDDARRAAPIRSPADTVGRGPWSLRRPRRKAAPPLAD